MRALHARFSSNPSIFIYIFLDFPSLQPYKSQQRLAVVFSTLFVALAFNAACFGPAACSGDFCVSLGASICMLLVSQLFSQLYVAAAQSAAERHAVWSYHTLLTPAALLGVIVASIFLCLVYSLPFDSALSARWLYFVLLSFAQSFFLTGPLWICFKAAFFIVLARFRMRSMTLQEQQKEALALKLGTNGTSETSESKSSSDGAHEAIGMSTIATTAVSLSTRTPPASSVHQHGGFQEFQDDDIDDDEVSHRNQLPRTIDQTAVPANMVVNSHFAHSALAGKNPVDLSAAQTSSEHASKRVLIEIRDAARFDIVPNITSVSDSEANSRNNGGFLVLEHNALFNPALLQAVTRSEVEAAHAPAASAVAHEVASSSPMSVLTPPRSSARTSLFLSANPLFNRSALSEAVGDGVGLDEFAVPTDNRMVILSPHTMNLSHNALVGMNQAAAASSAAANGDHSESSDPLATQ